MPGKIGPKENVRKTDQKREAPRRKTSVDQPASDRAPKPGILPGGDFSKSTFEQHAAQLTDDRLSQPMYARQRAKLVQQLQRDYGNHYVQRLIEHTSVSKRSVWVLSAFRLLP